MVVLRWVRGLLWMACAVQLLGCVDNKVQTSSSRMQADLLLGDARSQLLINLQSLMDERKFLFGQQRATLTGLSVDAKTPWGDGAYGRTSDIKELTGQDPAVLGIDVWDLAEKNPTWNRPAYAKAIRDFYDQGRGGAITLEWHMRGCDTQDEIDAFGNVGVPGAGFTISDWAKDKQASCLCRIVNQEPWRDGKTWLDWLFGQRLDSLADMLLEEKLDQIPLIFRPYHEQTGSWFWWGQKSWNCAQHLGRTDVITGAEAYKALFRITIDYLRKERKLNNLIFAFSPDKLCTHELHTCSNKAGDSGMIFDSDTQPLPDKEPTEQELLQDYMNSYPGRDYVDLVGIDLYYLEDKGQPWEKAAFQTALFKRFLKTLTRVAEQEGKIAALTETGNYNLHAEMETGSSWFQDHLLQLLTGSPDIRVAYALTWENRKIGAKEYYVPVRGHKAVDDFTAFSAASSSLLKDDAKGLYENTFAPLSQPKASRPTMPPGRGQSTASRSFPACSRTALDPDRDGWGWENGVSCQIQVCSTAAIDIDEDGWGTEAGNACQVAVCEVTSSDPDGDSWGYENGRSCRQATCKQASSDPDGDGWGWEDGRSCRQRVCRQLGSDPDGDGWGWEDNRSCRVALCSQPSLDPDGDGIGMEQGRVCQVRVCISSQSDPDGDGWGWENGFTCKVRMCKSAASDPDGDGWGWENNASCKIRMCSSAATDPDGDGWGWENQQSCRVRSN